MHTVNQPIPVSQEVREIAVSAALPSRYFRGESLHRYSQRASAKQFAGNDLEIVTFAQLLLLVERKKRGLPLTAASLRGASRLCRELAQEIAAS